MSWLYETSPWLTVGIVIVAAIFYQAVVKSWGGPLPSKLSFIFDLIVYLILAALIAVAFWGAGQ